MLELFSGTRSVGKVASNMGWHVVSLDRDLAADIQTDIMDWNYMIYPRGYFHFIWASPPCTEYARAKTVGVRKLEEADAIVERTWEIIDYFKPPLGYILENPQTGLLKDREVMWGRPYSDVDYCKYGMLYRKRTRLWNEMQHKWIPRPLCKLDCGHIKENTKQHLEVAQRAPKSKDSWQPRQTQKQLYRVPTQLIKEILLALE